MVSESQLDKSFERCQSNYLHETAFYECLVRAQVYVHVPVSDDSANVRLIQFRHPDGFDAIPVFTSFSRCNRAASRAVRALRLPCVQLMNSTRGATLMINPNDGGPVLYPEEVDSLLLHGTLEIFEKINRIEGNWDVREAEGVARGFVDALCAGASSTQYIKSVYLLERREVDSPAGDVTLLVYLGVYDEHSERAARHMIQVIQSFKPRPDRVVDIAVYDVSQPLPEFLDRVGATPIFRSATLQQSESRT